MTLLSPSHPEFREELIRQYIDRVKDGAEAFQLDVAYMVGLLDFNPHVPTSPDKSLPQGLLATHEEFLTRAREINPDVALASMTAFDRAFPHNEVAYWGLFTKDAGSMAVRYTFPEWTSTIVTHNPDEFAIINNGLRYGLVWSIAARQYTASMDEELTRPLARYVSELIRIRRRHADLLFHGRFNDTLGATVAGDDENIRYSVFTSMDPKNDARACVVVNFGERYETVEVGIQGTNGCEATITAPFEPDRIETLPVELTVPPNHAVVVVAER